MEKEPKCSYCELFGDKPHCHNCKIFNKAVTNREPHEIPYSLEDMIAYINNPENDFYGDFRIGDYKTIELFTGEKVRIVLIDTDKDDLANERGKARTTFAVMPIDGRYEMNRQSDRCEYTASKMRMNYLPRFLTLFPKELRDAIKQVSKKTGVVATRNVVNASTEALWLFSEVEILGDTRYSTQGEGEQYAYFSLRKDSGLPDYVWTRSPYNGGYFCVVRQNETSYDGSNRFHCALFGFCI